MKSITSFAVLPEGETYENTYGGWLEMFRAVAEAVEKPTLYEVPASWAPFLFYLGAGIKTVRSHFPEDKLTDFLPLDLEVVEARWMLRELVEIYSALRPELVDALYKSDVEWYTVGRRHTRMKQAFNVTCNGSFFRPEVMEYLRETLPSYQQTKRKCVIVPCAADKPYPAPLHTAVRENITDEYEIIVASGVLGLVPESLWGRAPDYDSGLPNEWRIMQTVLGFFDEHRYDRILVYSEYNALAIKKGLRDANIGPPTVVFLFQPRYYDSYENLLAPGHLARLKEAAK